MSAPASGRHRRTGSVWQSDLAQRAVSRATTHRSRPRSCLERTRPERGMPAGGCPPGRQRAAYPVPGGSCGGAQRVGSFPTHSVPPWRGAAARSVPEHRSGETTRLAGCQLDNPTWRYLTSRLRFSCICRFPLGFQSHFEGRRTLRSRAQRIGFVSRMPPGACVQVRRAHAEALTEAPGGARSRSVDAALEQRSGRSVTSGARERRCDAGVD